MAGDDGTSTVVVVVVARPADFSQVAPGPDLALVDALARLQLAAGRLGCSVRLRDVSEDLAQLLDLVGLPCGWGGPTLAVEAGGETEGGEELGVQEVVPPDDLPV